jgi:hypothetical protein
MMPGPKSTVDSQYSTLDSPQFTIMVFWADWFPLTASAAFRSPFDVASVSRTGSLVITNGLWPCRDRFGVATAAARSLRSAAKSNSCTRGALAAFFSSATASNTSTRRSRLAFAGLAS